MSDTSIAPYGEHINISALLCKGDNFPNSGVYTITFTKDISLGIVALKAINLKAGVTLDIAGSGDTLDGGGHQRGLFVYSGVVNVSDPGHFSV